MITNIIDDNGIYSFYRAPDVTDVNPAGYFSKVLKENFYWLRTRHFKFIKMPIPSSYDKKIQDSVFKDWRKEYETALKTDLDINLKNLFFTEMRKKDQQKLLKTIKLTPKQKFALFIQAGDKYQMKYSRYSYEWKPKLLEQKIYPKLIHNTKDGNFKVIGSTDITENQLKIALDDRRTIMIEFLTGKDFWHCIFSTGKGVSGKENSHKGFAHCHYLSSAYGYKKEYVLNELSKYRYNIDSDHIQIVRQSSLETL